MKKANKRILALFICLLLTITLVAGCANGDKPETEPEVPANGIEKIDLSEVEVTEPAKTLAEKEKEWLDKMTEVTREMDYLYDELNVGGILYSKFILELNELKPNFEELTTEVNDYLVENNIEETYKEDQLYTHGLAYGQKMRQEAETFFNGVFEGIVDESGKTKDLSKSEVLELYQETMINNYNTYYRELQNALARVEEVK